VKRLLAMLVLAALSAVASAAPAPAKEETSNLVSEVRAVRPPAPGLKLAVVEGDRFLRLENGGRAAIVVEGYDDEPYLRFQPDGTVQENTRSPSKYVNEDRYGRKPVPPQAQSRAAPRWRTVSNDGTRQWFDHRIHVMTPGTPPEVKDTSKRTKIFDWRVPMTVDGRPVAALGTLTWEPESSDSGGVSAGLVVGLALLAAALAAGAWLLLRRRRGRPDGPGPERPRDEAW
jgi:hypothetical protein